MESFPIGYYNFSKDEALNFQLNRFYSSRSLSYEELTEIGNKVQSFEEWIRNLGLVLDTMEEWIRVH